MSTLLYNSDYKLSERTLNYNMPFDQYQRYKTVQLIIDEFRNNSEKTSFSLLEIGANEFEHLESFLPLDVIQYSDISIPESKVGNPKYFAADATNLHWISDRYYDIVIACDVFEHVLKENREKFIAELYRVSKYGVIFCFPFEADYVERAEIISNEYYKAISGQNHIWLMEHIQNGRPELQLTDFCVEKYCDDFTSFQHGDVGIWEKLIKGHLFTCYMPELVSYKNCIDAYYNQYIYSYDVSDKNYRVFYIMGKQEGLTAAAKKIADSFKGEVSEENLSYIDQGIKELTDICDLTTKLNSERYLTLGKETSKYEGCVYWDTGEGFRQENSTNVAFEDPSYTATVQLPVGTRLVRFDPVELYPCIVFGLHITSDQGKVSAHCINGRMMGEYYLFDHDDPQFLIDLQGKHVRELRIRCTCCPVEQDLLTGMLSQVGQLLQDEAQLEQGLAELRKSLEETKAEKEQEKAAWQQEIASLQGEHEQEKADWKQELASLQGEHENTVNILEEKSQALQDAQALSVQMQEKISGLEQQIAFYSVHYPAAIHGRDEMTAHYQAAMSQYQAVINSTFWKCTKPFRVTVNGVKRFCKAVPGLRLVYKVVSSLRSVGIKGTRLKIKQRLQRKKVQQQQNAGELLTAAERAQQRNTGFSKEIKISILVPLYNTPSKLLHDMIKSVQEQTYENWELCLADGSDNEHKYVGVECQQLAKKDKRILYKKLEKNYGISENTNRCIDMATGDYIGLLDHDDILHPAALFEVMKQICGCGADFIYTDESTFRHQPSDAYLPHFKPDFAPDSLRALNYICHFSCFSKELLDKVGGFRSEFNGSQDYDMVLRLTEQARKIVHIPKILYYWRASETSVASDVSAKPYTIDAAKHALAEHLKRIGLKGEILDAYAPTTYHIRYDIQDEPLISILIPNRNEMQTLKVCIDSIYEQSSYRNFEIIIVENNSNEPDIFEYYKDLEKNHLAKVVVWEGIFNYSAINNFGVKHTSGEYLLLLNNDVEVISADWLQEMLMFAQRPDVGAVGAKLLYPDNTIQHAGVILGIGGVAGHAHKYFHRNDYGYMNRIHYAQNLSAVTAACLMVSRKVFDEVGGLDETFGVAFNDVDFCMQIRKAGYLNVYTPFAELYHYESKSRGYEDTPEKRARFEGEVRRFQDRWRKELAAGDPYYNPNLTLDREDFSLR